MNRSRLLLVSFCLAALFPAARCVAAIRSGDNPKSNHRIVVLTYNIHHGEGTDGKFDLERIAGIIKRASPDIVSLQEVDRATVRSKGVDQAQELARLTGMNLAFGRAIDYQGGQYGNAVLTRFVIQRTATYPLPAPEPRALLAVECSLSSRGSPEGVFTFIATHLDWRNSIESVPLIEERFKEDPNKPALLAGDLNAGQDSPTMKLLGETWSIAGAASIDYILYRPASRWRAIEAKVLDEKVASDHPPVVAVVELLPAPKRAEQTGAAVTARQEDAQGADGTHPLLEELFARARDNTAQVYAEARDELLAQGAPAIEFLEKKVRSRAPEQERWLAEIMLARAKEPAEFRDLELSFHKKVLVARYANPVTLSRRRVRIPARGMSLSLHSEVPCADKEHWERITSAAPGGSLDAKLQKEFYEFLQLSDSPLWKPLASEILLKGWTVPADSLWWPPPLPREYRPGEHNPPTGPLGRVYTLDFADSDDMTAMLDQGDYVHHAIVLVGKFGERRAGDRVLEILQGIHQPIPDEPPTAGFFDCREAIRTLGKLRHKEALDTLLKWAEDGRVPRGLRPDVLLSIAQIGDKKAIPVLERISKSQPDVAEDAKGLLEVLRGTRPVSDFEPLDD